MVLDEIYTFVMKVVLDELVFYRARSTHQCSLYSAADREIRRRSPWDGQSI